jgi:Raf kinase inhibitor-like YbhB/YbcL family protein
MSRFFLFISAVFFLTGSVLAFEIKSPDIKEGGVIPREFTCAGRNQSPALSWSGEPKGTVSFVLICEDPDAPLGTWAHWLIFDIPASIHELTGGVASVEILPSGARQGRNDFQMIGYGGPCPPVGQSHRYMFKLVALDEMLLLSGDATRDRLVAAMQGHVLAETKLTGTFKR